MFVENRAHFEVGPAESLALGFFGYGLVELAIFLFGDFLRLAVLSAHATVHEVMT